MRRESSSQGGHNESQFITLNVQMDRGNSKGPIACTRRKNQSVLTMLLDKYYHQKENKGYCHFNSTSDDKIPLKSFLQKFGLGSFYPQLALKGYKTRISSFFLIPDACFDKTLISLKANNEQKKIFHELRSLLFSLKRDNDETTFKGEYQQLFARCRCCKVEDARKSRLNSGIYALM